MQLAQAVGQVFERERAVLEVDAALQAGILQRAVRFHLEGGGAARGQVGIERLGQLEIDGAAGGKIQLPRALEREAALRAQVGVFAGDVQRIETDRAIGQQWRARRLRFAGGRRRCQPPTAATALRREADRDAPADPRRVTVPASAESPLKASTCAMRSRAPMLNREKSSRARVS